MAKESETVVALVEHEFPTKNTLHVGQEIEIPLGDLFISLDNVRKTKRARIPELAANIKAHGLMQRLQVTRDMAEGKSTGRFGVEAGGRRLLALQYLAEHNQITPDTLVGCRLVAKETAVAVSLAENIGLELMHPADEFAAFRHLIERGMAIDDVARAYGQTSVQVKRRLKMARVAPKLLRLYRQDKMTLDQLMVLASVENRQRQLAAWKQCGHWNSAAQLKRCLIEDEIKSDDPRVKLVGLEAYKSRGGALREDLFSAEGGFYLEDPALIWYLLGEMVDAKVASVQTEGWGWVESRETLDYAERHAYHALPSRSRLPSEEEAGQLAQLKAAHAVAQTALDAADGDENHDDALQTAADAAMGALRMARDSLIVPASEDKAYAGAIVHVVGGNIEVLRGLVRADDFKRLRKDMTTGGPSEGSQAPSTASPKVPERLMQDLTSHSTAAMQVAMMDNPKVALAVLACTLAQKAFSLHADTVLKVSLSLHRSEMDKHSPSLHTSCAGLRLDAAQQAWRDRLPQDENAWFSWFLEQPQEVILSLLVYAGAVSVQGINQPISTKGKQSELGSALGLDMAQWWQATPSSYLALVPKAKIIEAVTEARDAVTADKMRKMKKDEAVAFAAQCLEGTNWLPSALRLAAL
jgi:ParB family transcriptional regulator, chromosome partitioning protein